MVSFWLNKRPCFEEIHTEVIKSDGTSCLQLTFKWFKKLYIIAVSYICTGEIMRRGGRERKRKKENGENVNK